VIVRRIALTTNYDLYGGDGTLALLEQQSWAIGEFVSRPLKTLKVRDKFSDILCQCGPATGSRFDLSVFEHNLLVDVPFDPDEYKRKPRDQLNSYFAHLLRTGIPRAAGVTSVPAAPLLQAVDDGRCVEV